MRASRSHALLLIAALGLTLPAGASSERVLIGTYSTETETGPIRATFTPSGEGEDGSPTWKVVFLVAFDSQEYTYRGSASGSLDEGELSGWVDDETGSTSYSFRGEHRDGKFEASHAELRGFEEVPTGTMELVPEVPAVS